MKHVVMFSGGIGSWATAKRVIERHGKQDVVLLFADVAGDRHRCDCGHLDEQHINGRGPCDVQRDGEYCGCTSWKPTTHVGEDTDTYRFIDDAVAQLGVPLVTVKDPGGRDIYTVFRDRKWLGNSRTAHCSEELKQKPCHAWLKANCDPADTIVYVGISWDEIHRLPAVKKAYADRGWKAEAPMCDEPYLDKDDMLNMVREVGIVPPRAYAMHFSHNNCGGFCVKAGLAHFRNLLNRNRERYLFHEQREQDMRDYLNKDVTILDGITLRDYRERIESQGILFSLSFDEEFDVGGCGCFVDEEAS